MSNSTVSKLFECRGTGMVVTPQGEMQMGMDQPSVRGQAEHVAVLDEATKWPTKKEFDPNVIANGLVDEKKEGGTLPARSTGTSGMSNTAIPGTGLGFQGAGEGPYELSGFTVRYNVPESTDIGSVEVQVNFPTIEAAQSTIVGSIYNHTTPKGVLMECEITKGGPVICTNEIEKLKYIEGRWIRP